MMSGRQAKSVFFAGLFVAALAVGLMKTNHKPRAVDLENEVAEELQSAHRSPEPIENLDAAAEFARAKVDALLKSQKSAPSGMATASSKVDPKPEFKSPAEQALERLVRIRHCERLAGTMDRKTSASGEAAGCPVNHPEALEHAGGYAQVLVDQTAMELAFLRELVLAARSSGLNDPYDVARVAGVYVKHADDNVREQALALAKILPSSQGRVAMEIAIQALKSTVSGPLSTQALEILIRHRGIEPKMADRAVVRALKESGWDVRDAVASQSLPFVTAQNREEFAKIMNSEPERSKLRLHLRLNLEEFDRMARL